MISNMAAERAPGERRALTPASKAMETPSGLRRKNSTPVSFSAEGLVATIRPTMALGLGMGKPPFSMQRDYISKVREFSKAFQLRMAGRNVAQPRAAAVHVS